MENLWDVLKRNVVDKQPSSASALVDVIKNVWIKEISAEYCLDLIYNIPRLIQVVMQNKGGHTKY